MQKSLKMKITNLQISNLYLLVYSLFAICIILIQYLFENNIDLFVSDALSLTNTYNNLYSFDNFNIFDLHYSYWGLYYLYYLFEENYWIVNLLLILLSFVF